MINQLSGRRLIQVREAANGEPVYSIHRLLQQKIQLDMDNYGFADSFRRAFRLIRKRYPRAEPTQVPDPETWDVCGEYMPHIYSFQRVFEEVKDDLQITQLVDPKPVEIAELFYDAGFHVWARGTTGFDGLSFLDTAKGILEAIQMDPYDKLHADIGCMAGLLLLNLGCRSRVAGTRRLQRAAEIRKKIWMEHPESDNNDVMYRNSVTDYSLCLLNEHRFDEAGRLMTECLERYREWGSEEDNPFEYSKYYGNYSVVLMWEGRMKDAIRYVERCIQYTEKFSGKASMYYRRQFLLGCYLLQSADIQGALDKHLETLIARLALHGKHHEFTILSMYAVGATYHHLGDPNTAM